MCSHEHAALRDRAWYQNRALPCFLAGNLESGNVDLHTIWQQHLHQQSLQQQQESSAEGAEMKHNRVQVMVVQPGNEVAIGTQVPDPKQTEQSDLRTLSHKEAATKLVDEASARDASHQMSSS